MSNSSIMDCSIDEFWQIVLIYASYFGIPLYTYINICSYTRICTYIYEWKIIIAVTFIGYFLCYLFYCILTYEWMWALFHTIDVFYISIVDANPFQLQHSRIYRFFFFFFLISQDLNWYLAYLKFNWYFKERRKS